MPAFRMLIVLGSWNTVETATLTSYWLWRFGCMCLSSSSFRCPPLSWGWEQRHRMIVVIELCFDPISYLNSGGFHGGRVGLETDFPPVRPPDKIGIAVDTHDLALDDSLSLQSPLLSRGSTGPLWLAGFHLTGSGRLGLCSRGEAMLNL